MLPNKVYARYHGMTLTSIVGLRWASMIIPLMEKEMIVEGEQIQSASEKFPTPVEHFFSMDSMIWRIRRQRRYCRPRRRFYQQVSSWLDLDRRGLLPYMDI
jgi:hypothetical protein